MENETLDNQESVTPDETQDSNLETEDFESKFLKAEEVAKNQKIRAEKAEKELKALKNAPKEEPKEEPRENKGHSLADIRALNKVHDDDVERVEKFAKSEGISIAEALKSEDLKAILDRREEMRKTAEATNTSGSKRSSNAPTPEQIVEAGLGGKEVDPVKFAEAQMALKQKRVKT